jgi:hypothetical protein
MIALIPAIYYRLSIVGFWLGYFRVNIRRLSGGFA